MAFIFQKLTYKFNYQNLLTYIQKLLLGVLQIVKKRMIVKLIWDGINNMHLFFYY